MVIMKPKPHQSVCSNYFNITQVQPFPGPIIFFHKRLFLLDLILPQFLCCGFWSSKMLCCLAGNLTYQDILQAHWSFKVLKNMQSTNATSRTFTISPTQLWEAQNNPFRVILSQVSLTFRLSHTQIVLEISLLNCGFSSHSLNSQSSHTHYKTVSMQIAIRKEHWTVSEDIHMQTHTAYEYHTIPDPKIGVELILQNQENSWANVEQPKERKICTVKGIVTMELYEMVCHHSII